jgi:hypothetical protein
VDIEYYKIMFLNKSALSMETIEDIQKAGIELIKYIEKLEGELHARSNK